MRIYGGRDYYDCAMSMGIDPNIVFLRNRRECRDVPVEKAGGSLLNYRLEAMPYTMGLIHNYAVVLCGTVYRGAELECEYFWSADKLRAKIAGIKSARLAIRSRQRAKFRMTLDEWFTPFDVSTHLREYMIRNKYSIMLEADPREHWEERVFKINRDGLKEIGFAKAVDPYTAYQELSMWIGGILGGTSPEIVRIKDDKVLAENHGFDRFSFRGPRI